MAEKHPSPTPAASSAAASPRRHLKSLNTAIDVLEVLGDAHDAGCRVTDIARRLGIGKATVHGVLSNLEARGFVLRGADAVSYRLGRNLWKLGLIADRQIDLKALSRKHLRDLTEATSESSLLSEYSSVNHVLYLEHVVCSSPVQAYVRMGDLAPAHCVASGLVLLAHQDEAEMERVCAAPLKGYTPLTTTDPDALRRRLAEIRAQGYAINRGEYRADIVGIAAPIFNHEHVAVAAISLSGPAYRFSITPEAHYVDLIRRYADRISGEIGGRG